MEVSIRVITLHKSHSKKYKHLEEQFKAGKITKDEFNKAIDKMVLDRIEESKALPDHVIKHLRRR